MDAMKGLCQIAGTTSNQRPHHPQQCSHLWLCRGQRFRWRFVARLPRRGRLRCWRRLHCRLHLIKAVIKMLLVLGSCDIIQ